MAKPKDKGELLLKSRENFEILQKLINQFTPNFEDKEFPAGTMNRNVRDVLGHLYHWHLMMLDWHKVGMRGEKPQMPAKGYSWKDTPILNREIWQKCQTYSLEEIYHLLCDTHHTLMEIIASFDSNDLFEKKKYKWTGSTSVGAYMISATSSHYDWAIKLIKRSLS